MPVDDRLVSLVKQVGAFHITQRAMHEAQVEMERALTAGDLDENLRRRYFAVARRYFSGFEREARGHLRDVDRRLDHVNQVHFNLAAERGVAVKRIEATNSVLTALDEVEERIAQ